MRTRGAMLACALGALMGCPRDPDESRPRRDATSDATDAELPRDVTVVDADASDVTSDVVGADADVTDAGAGEAGVDADVPNASADADATSADADAPEVRTDVVVDVPDASADVVPSISFTFVSGVVSGNAGETSINARFVWHGSIRDQSADGQTRIEAFFR